MYYAGELTVVLCRFREWQSWRWPIRRWRTDLTTLNGRTVTCRISWPCSRMTSHWPRATRTCPHCYTTYGSVHRSYTTYTGPTQPTQVLHNLWVSHKWFSPYRVEPLLWGHPFCNRNWLSTAERWPLVKLMHVVIWSLIRVASQKGYHCTVQLLYLVTWHIMSTVTPQF